MKQQRGHGSCFKSFCTEHYLYFIMIGLIGLGIPKIIMGAIYLHDCDIEKMIPIYLIVSGVLQLFFIWPLLSFWTPLFFCFKCCIGVGTRRPESFREIINASIHFGFRFMIGFIALGLIFNLINTAWLVCGSIWVYPNYGKLTSDNVTCSHEVMSNCINGTCNMKFMTFAFAMVTIDWAICFALVGIYVNEVFHPCSRSSEEALNLLGTP